ncbi:hypothetical protein [Nonomuraea aurantiaca]|uniref:hypothetical protein n=1 Tax=Nonomuraea aurantiaca TaxID=2878562 RepID=UPI001CD9DF12|nr:hypothetical protein [Nonomuraea aurantiaca]MCA2221909.1 hypothetical protein [Nonomuraea aurantiaca]
MACDSARGERRAQGQADFGAFGTVTTFSWLSPDVRGRRLTREQRIKRRRDDIELVAVGDCLQVLGIGLSPAD